MSSIQMKQTDYCHPIIKNGIIQFHTSSLEIVNFKPDEKYGILEISMSKTEQTTQPIHLMFDIDISDSMNDNVKMSYTKTKLNYIQKTLDCIFKYIIDQPTINIYISVNCFNIHYCNIIKPTKLTISNKEILTRQIYTIVAYGGTNIEKTFIESSKSIIEYKKENPTHKTVYILLTDGIPSVGKIDIPSIVKIKPDAYNICIGYGSDHDSKLLQQCGEYIFINDYEKTGNEYGEILYRLLNPALEQVKIEIKNGLIYDSKTNSWESYIIESELYSEQIRTFHIKSISSVEAIISGKVIGKIKGFDNELVDDIQQIYIIETLPNLIDESYNILPVDLRKNMYRYKTQELLFESVKYAKNNITNKLYKLQLKDFFKNMRSYMRENNLLNDSFMKLLCDDIFVIFKTLGKNNAEMYLVSRSQSQGRQRPCRVSSSSLDDEYEMYNNSYIPTNSLTRDITNSYNEINSLLESDYVNSVYIEEESSEFLFNEIVNNIDDELEHYKSEKQDSNLYSCEGILDVMNSINPLL